MKRYLRIYKAIIKINIALIFAYRMSFINNIISTCGWGLFNIAWVLLLSYRVKSIFGWRGDELVIISIGYLIVSGINYCLFAANFDNFSRIVDRGELDGFLLKPLDSQFHISTIRLGFANFFRGVMGIGILIWWVSIHHYSISIFPIIGFILLIGVGVLLMYSIWFLFITLLIWYPNMANLVELLFTFNGLSRYPVELFLSRGVTALLIFIPIALIVSTPVKVLLQKNAWPDVGIMIMLTFVLFYLSRIFWKYALKHYTSAS